MATATLDSVLTAYERLSFEDKTLFSETIQKRQIEAWRKETAAEAKKARKLVRSGKLKALPLDQALAELAAIADEEQLQPNGRRG